jgi:hypothetical protein
MIKATLAAAALSATSNVLAQFFEAYREQKPFVFDLAKILRFVMVTLITTPPNYQWQQYLERTFPGYDRTPSSPALDVEKQARDGGEDGADRSPKPKLNLRNTMTKWFIDCITVGAIVNTILFFILMGFLKRQPLAQIGDNIRNETIPVIVAGYKIWPFASIISFSCIPVERRIIFLNFVGLIWGIYMSLVAARV